MPHSLHVYMCNIMACTTLAQCGVCWVVGALIAAASVQAQAPPLPPGNILSAGATAPPGGDLSLNNFAYNAGNTAALVRVCCLCAR
jgi:hypothetical protein